MARVHRRYNKASQRYPSPPSVRPADSSDWSSLISWRSKRIHNDPSYVSDTTSVTSTYIDSSTKYNDETVLSDECSHDDEDDDGSVYCSPATDFVSCSICKRQTLRCVAEENADKHFTKNLMVCHHQRLCLPEDQMRTWPRTIPAVKAQIWKVSLGNRTRCHLGYASANIDSLTMSTETVIFGGVYKKQMNDADGVLEDWVLVQRILDRYDKPLYKDILEFLNKSPQFRKSYYKIKRICALLELKVDGGYSESKRRMILAKKQREAIITSNTIKPSRVSRPYIVEERSIKKYKEPRDDGNGDDDTGVLSVFKDGVNAITDSITYELMYTHRIANQAIFKGLSAIFAVDDYTNLHSLMERACWCTHLPDHVSAVTAAAALTSGTLSLDKIRKGRSRTPLRGRLYYDVASRRRMELLRPWELSKQERTRNHGGYKGVDKESLLRSASSFAPTKMGLMDRLFLWESRFVKQGFLHNKSIMFSKNWFGGFLIEREEKGDYMNIPCRACDGNCKGKMYCGFNSKNKGQRMEDLCDCWARLEDEMVQDIWLKRKYSRKLL